MSRVNKNNRLQGFKASWQGVNILPPLKRRYEAFLGILNKLINVFSSERIRKYKPDTRPYKYTCLEIQGKRLVTTRFRMKGSTHTQEVIIEGDRIIADNIRDDNIPIPKDGSVVIIIPRR